MIILGNNPGILDAQVNTHEMLPEEYFVARVLERATVSVDIPSDEELGSGSQASTSGSSFSSTMSSETQSENSDINAKETTEDAMEYIAGYIAKNLRTPIPN